MSHTPRSKVEKINEEIWNEDLYFIRQNFINRDV